MARICGKCGFSSADATWGATEGCPKCGAVYAKVEQHQQTTADKARVEAGQRQAAAAKAEEKAMADAARAVQVQAAAARGQEQKLNESLICKTCGTAGKTKGAVTVDASSRTDTRQRDSIGVTNMA